MAAALGVVGGAGRLVTLTWKVETELPVAVIRFEGVLDVDTAPEVRLAVATALALQPAAVVADLAGLTAAAADDDLTVFAACARSAAAWPGCPVALSGPPDAVAAGLARMSVNRSAVIHPDLDHALAALEAVPPPLRFRQRLTAAPSITGPAARAMVVAACEAWGVNAAAGLEQVANRAELVVTELVSNAIIHAKTELEVVVALREPFLHISVADGSPAPPRLLSPDAPDTIGGRGLILVETLTTKWGYLPTRDGKVVWTMMRLGPPPVR
ncbi:ATP-binding protein [Planosporangium thailandense]|uniref:ATP-binding protein n=1 Tax=Planosporangium thailandense TaxID=765197 RepID=A0ABX0Y310_9ACTN|nr:ATP-binding protein [Planosporangium thailandense]NJC72733.1 ATP-binding protein [Planosporangium thailandense]